MQVKIKGPRLSSDGYSGMKDDVITVPDEIGVKFCGMGWAEDVEGKVPTGDRKTAPVTINPKKLMHNQETGGV